jgi:ABC-2 type transport system ATP-binding protein
MGDLLARLHVSHYILELARPMERAPVVEGYGLELSGERSLSAAVPAELGIHGLFRALAELGVEVVALRNAANRLEQLFVDLLENQPLSSPAP